MVGRGRSCEEHRICGEALAIDSVVRFRSIQIINDADFEEKAIEVFWVTDGIDRCLVCFLPRHCVRHGEKYEGRVAQVVKFLKLMKVHLYDNDPTRTEESAWHVS